MTTLDLLVTDVIMPKVDGVELAKQAKGKYRDLKILFISGYTEDVLARRYIMAGDSGFLEKPFSPDELLKKCFEILNE